MPISAQEQKDLDQLHRDQATEQARFSSLVIHYLRMEPEMLRHHGSKTREEAIFKSTEAHKKTLEKLVQAHIKKYPDQMHKYPLLRCPICKYEYRPQMHGWAFKTDKNTKCDPASERPTYSHPFVVVEEQ